MHRPTQLPSYPRRHPGFIEHSFFNDDDLPKHQNALAEVQKEGVKVYRPGIDAFARKVTDMHESYAGR